MKRYILFLLLVFSIWPGQPARAEAASKKATPGIVYRLPPAQQNDLSGIKFRIQGSSVSFRVNASLDMPGYVLHSFIAALKTYPKERYIRISWSMLVFNNGVDATVLYDRKKHSVAYFNYGDGDLGSHHDHIQFTGVREEAFIKIAEAHRNDYDERSDGFFEDLDHHGSKRRDLGSWQKEPPP